MNNNQSFHFGMIGLGVMGRNLLLNMADHGFSVIGFDKDPSKGAALESSANPGTVVKGVNTLAEMLEQLERPRRLMMLVPAGKPVDDVLGELMPLLDKDDIIIDGGNSHYTDTLRRLQYMAEKGFHFMGVGVSGGERGARTGPSIMPGGDRDAYAKVAPILTAVSAKVNGEPCVDYLGTGAAGHYVKMVHNGIEYSIMQLISESYALLKQGAGYSNDQLHEVFRTWNEGDMQSFLVELTADVFLQKDDITGNRLVDMILDKAGAKGTGKWTSQDALDLGIAIPVIDTAVAIRNISAVKEERTQAAKIYPTGNYAINNPGDLEKEVHDALYFGTLISYVQGMAQLQKASAEWKMEIPLEKVVRVWRGGCIIRSILLEPFYKAYSAQPDLVNLLLHKDIADLIPALEASTRSVVQKGIQAGIPVAGLASALSYFDAYRSSWLPTNLIQAQRDYFGAHTYQRTDQPGTFHTEWQHQ
jgi:6-phosphogluconate dehydrogenase